jgi:hypothetical protein
MNRTMTIAVALGIVLLLGAPVHADFYYGTYGPIDLDIDSSKVMVKCSPTLTPLQQITFLESIDRIAEVLQNPETLDGFVVCSLTTGADYRPFLDSVQLLSEVDFAEPFYQLTDGTPVYIGQTICVAFDSTLSQAERDSLIDMHELAVERELMGMRVPRSGGSGLDDMRVNLIISGSPPFRRAF